MNTILRRFRFALQTLIARIATRVSAQLLTQWLAWLAGQEIISADEQSLILKIAPQIAAFIAVEVLMSSLEWLWQRKELSFFRDLVDAMTAKLEAEQQNTEIALTLPEDSTRADIEETKRIASEHDFRLPNAQ